MKLWWIGLCLLCLGSACENIARKQLIKEAPYITQRTEDDRGKVFSFVETPRRIVSIAPNITEILFGLHASSHLIARSEACNYPPEAQEIPTISTYPQLNLEELTALDADIVFSTDEVFSEVDIVSMEQAGIPIFIQKYDSLQDIYRGIRTIGRILDKDASAGLMADSLQQLERHLVSLTTNLAQYRTLFLVEEDPLTVVGGRGILNELIGKSGGKNIFQDLTILYATPGIQEIVSRSPEFIIYPTPDSKQLQRILSTYPLLTETPAYINRQVFSINPDWMYRPGPRTIRGLLELTHVLHSSLTPDNIVNSQRQDQ